MARIRYLKPEFFLDDDIGKLSFETRLFYQGLWVYADKKGRLEERIEWLKASIFPYNRVDIKKCLDELSQIKEFSHKPFIYRYKINNINYIQILSWDKHQTPHHTEKDSQIPEPPDITQLSMQSSNLPSSSPYVSSLSPSLIFDTNTNININIKDKDKDKDKDKCPADTPPLNNGYITVKQPLNNGYITVKAIVDDLNAILSTSYKHNTKKIIDLINARLNEGFTLDDFKQVHRNMAKRWGTDNKMREFLRPITLYSNKFESYLNIKQELPCSTQSAKNYLVGQEWLKKKSAIPTESTLESAQLSQLEKGGISNYGPEK